MSVAFHWRCIIGRQASSNPHSAGCSEYPWTMDADAGSVAGVILVVPVQEGGA